MLTRAPAAGGVVASNASGADGARGQSAVVTGGAVWVGYTAADNSSRGYLDLASGGGGGLLIAASPALNALTQGTLSLWMSAPRGGPASRTHWPRRLMRLLQGSKP